MMSQLSEEEEISIKKKEDDQEFKSEIEVPRQQRTLSADRVAHGESQEP